MKNLKSNLAVMGASTFVLVVMPTITHAAGIGELLSKVRTWLNMLVPMMITLGIIAFFWGLVKYLFNDGSEGKGEGLKIMMYGILAIFVMGSLGGIVALLQDTTNTKSGGTINAPCVGKTCSNQ